MEVKNKFNTVKIATCNDAHKAEAVSQLFERSLLFNRSDDICGIVISKNDEKQFIPISAIPDNVNIEKRDGVVTLVENPVVDSITTKADHNGIDWKSQHKIAETSAERTIILLCTKNIEDATNIGVIGGEILEVGEGVYGNYKISLTPTGSGLLIGATTFEQKAALVRAKYNGTYYYGIKFKSTVPANIYFSGWDHFPDGADAPLYTSYTDADLSEIIELESGDSGGSSGGSSGGGTATNANKIIPNYTRKTLAEVTSDTTKYIKLADCAWNQTGTLQVYLTGSNIVDTLVIDFGGGNGSIPMLCGYYSGNDNRVLSVIAQKGLAWDSNYSIYVKISQLTTCTVNVALLKGDCTINISESTTEPTDISEWPVSYGLFGTLTGNSSSATNADKVDNYHAVNLWRSDGANWNPFANVTMGATTNGSKWTFAMVRNGKTGCYWHVWDADHGSLLKVNADDGKVSAPKGFVGNLSGKADTAGTADKVASEGVTGSKLTLQGSTVSSNSYTDTNPKLVFNNIDGSQSISLTFNDFDEVQAPASLTLNGNQGNEYFIAPNIKANRNITLDGASGAGPGTYGSEPLTIGFPSGTGDGQSLGFDRNSIQARTKDSASIMYLNYHGGMVHVNELDRSDGGLKVKNKMVIPIGAPSSLENGCIWIQ